MFMSLENPSGIVFLLILKDMVIDLATSISIVLMLVGVTLKVGMEWCKLFMIRIMIL
jgi:hypothetical protein